MKYEKYAQFEGAEWIEISKLDYQKGGIADKPSIYLFSQEEDLYGYLDNLMFLIEFL